MDLGLRSELRDGPLDPLWVILQHVDQHVRVDQDHPSSRNMRIRSSVRHFTVALPLTDSKRSFTDREAAPFARASTTCPCPSTAKPTPLPGRSRKASRMCLGMVTCPLLVTFVDMVRS